MAMPTNFTSLKQGNDAQRVTAPSIMQVFLVFGRSIPSYLACQYYCFKSKNKVQLDFVVINTR